MKKFLKKLRMFSMYRRIVISFMVIISVFVVAIAGVIYSIFNHTMLRELEYVENSSLLKSENAMAQLYEDAFSISYSIWSLPQVNSIFRSVGIDRVNEYHVFLEMKKLQNVYGQILGITVNDEADQRFFGTAGAGYISEDSIVVNLEGSGDRGMHTIRRRIQKNASIPTSEEVDVVSFVYRPAGQQRRNSIELDVRADYIEQLIHYGSEEEMDMTFVLSDEGEVLVGDDSVLSLGFDWQKLLNDEPLSMQTYDYDGKVLLISRCDVEIPGWNIVRIMPYVARTAASAFFKNVLLIVCGVILAGFVVIIYLIKRLYDPIGRLVDDVDGITRTVSNVESSTVDEIKTVHDALNNYVNKIEMLNDYRNRASSFIEQQFVRFMLQGENGAAAEALELMHVDVHYWDNKRFTAVTMKMDSMTSYLQVYSSRERSFHRFALSNVLSDLLGDMLVQGLVRMDSETYGALLAYCGSFPTDAILALKDCQEYMLQHFNIAINIGVGDSVESWQEASESCKMAFRRMNQGFYSKPGCLIDSTCEYAQESAAVYPMRIVPKLREAIMQKDFEKAEAGLSNFVKAIERFEPRYIRVYAERFVNDLFLEMAHHNIVLRPNETVMHPIQGAEHLYEVVNALKGYLAEISERAQQKTVVDEVKNDKLLLYAKEYVDAHYADADLSVEMLADMVKLSPAYFGKLFSKMFSVSCTNYIIDVRMNRAASMLVETNETVRAISELVGISAPNYFFLVFKKKFGITPAQYRKQYQKENVAETFQSSEYDE